VNLVLAAYFTQIEQDQEATGPEFTPPPLKVKITSDAGKGWVVAAVDRQTFAFVVNEENFYWTWEFLFTVTVDADAV